MIRVVQISESEYSVKGHGVHTAYMETCAALEKRAEITLRTNTFEKADIRHIHTVGPYSLVQLLFASGKKVVSAHVVPDSFVGSLVGAKYWLGIATRYLRWFYNRADLAIAVSDQTKKDLEAIGVTSPISVIYNMIDTEKYKQARTRRDELRQKFDVKPSERVVVGNGQIQPRKRFDTFLAIARQLPEVKFIWVGGMPFGKVAADQSKMQEMIDTAPDNVTVTGVVPIETVAEYFAASDVFVMTSEQETFGLAIIEAAASGLPVVLRDINDYDHTFRADALMCSEGEFAPKIAQLLDDEKLYRDLQQRAENIAQRYDSSKIVSGLIEHYQALLKK